MKFNLQKKYFILIKQGKKLIEGRLNKSKYKELSVGDSVVFVDQEDKTELNKNVRFILTAKNFMQAFEILSFKQAIPDALTEKDAIKAYRVFYSEEDENKYGVILIGID